jgi:hypothetical protein
MVTLAAALSLHLMPLPASDGSQPNEAPSSNVLQYIPAYVIMQIKHSTACSKRWLADLSADHRNIFFKE